MNLLIVESPSKCGKISKFLGQGWKVMATKGHIRELPAEELGIEPNHDFRQTYQIKPTHKKLVDELLKAMGQAENIYIATDPDREGEAIGWHLVLVAQGKKAIAKEKPIYRVTFNAITAEAVKAAVAAPRPIDMCLVEAQLARRAVDRLLGYPASNAVSRELKKSYSAGRVQTVALRIVVQREMEISLFTPTTYWTFEAKLQTQSGQSFQAQLMELEGKKPDLKDERLVKALYQRLAPASYWVGNVSREEKLRQPHAPFTTSSLQQAASQALNLSPQQTMEQAQALYEAGYITYMRTDSTEVAPAAQKEVRTYIYEHHGASYLPDTPPVYKSKAVNAQEAHECIRPAKVTVLPDEISDVIQKYTPLYALIWKRFVASQMSPARYDAQVITIKVGANQQAYPVLFEAKGRTLAFDGFLKIWVEPANPDEVPEPDHVLLPVLQINQPLKLEKVSPEQHQTKAPARYTEASLIQAMERKGIGRPSTYAETLNKLRKRHYVHLEKKRLLPTPEGMQVCDFLISRFPDVFDEGYTSRLEAELDQVAAGEQTRSVVLHQFWSSFHPVFQQIMAAISDKRQAELKAAEIGESCPECQAPLMQRTGKKGLFIGCSGYPQCSYTRSASKPVVIQMLPQGQ